MSNRTQRTSRLVRIGLPVAAVLGAIALYLVIARPAWAPWIGGSRINVLLITVDTTRADYLSCYGAQLAPTPAMDRLAQQGVMFLRCEACIPQTVPSHCSIMTGTYPFIHGVRRNGTEVLAAEADTLAERLKASGYLTGAVVAFFGLNRPSGLSQGFDVYDDVKPPRQGVRAEQKRRANGVSDTAIALLHSAGRRPFFLWAHFYDPHHPYRSKRTADEDSSLAYADEVAFMDGHIGRLLDELVALKLDQNTLVVLVGDHGEGLDEHGEFQHGYYAYETTLRVPLLIRFPGKVPAGARLEPVVRTIDVPATILDLAGLSPLPSAQGISLNALMTGKVTDPQLHAYGETDEAYDTLRLGRVRSLLAGNWKYIHSTRPQLYDLEHDPGETHNLAASQPELVAKLTEDLGTLLDDAPSLRLVAPAAALSEQEVRDLQSLGYVGHAGPASAPSGAETLDPGGQDPHDFAPQIALIQHGRKNLSLRNLDEAERQFRQVSAVLPDAPDVLRELGYVMELRRSWDECYYYYERALAQKPADRQVRQHLAKLLMDNNRAAAALPHLERLAQDFPEDFDSRYALSSALRSVKRYDDARQQLEIAVRLRPNDVQALHALGLTHAALQQPDQAAEYFRRALALDANFAPARAALDNLTQHP